MRDDTVLRKALSDLTPQLRRYARALTTGQAAPCELADDLVQATLMRALGARFVGSSADLKVRLYATVTQLNREVVLTRLEARAAGAGGPALGGGASFPPQGQTRLASALMSLGLEAREPLLLVALEGFDYAEVARILRVSRQVVISRLTQARTALDAALKTSALQTAALRTGLRGSSQTANRDSGMSSRPAARHVPYLRVVT